MIKIITDATIDFDLNFLKDNDIELISMSYTLDGVNYIDDKTLDIHNFYNLIREGKMPTTSMISPIIYEETFEKHLKENNDILYIGFSSGLSGCFNASLLAKRSLEDKYSNKIECLDSHTASAGIGILVKKAVEMKNQGKNLQEIVDALNTIKSKICVLLGVDNLFHLQRGGRVSKTAAVIGTALNLKPIIKVNEEGKLLSFKKVMGRKKIMFTYLDYVQKYLDHNEKDSVYILNGDCLDDAKEFKNKLDEKLNISSNILSIGTIIGTHTGADALAIIFVANDIKENIK